MAPRAVAVMAWRSWLLQQSIARRLLGRRLSDNGVLPLSHFMFFISGPQAFSRAMEHFAFSNEHDDGADQECLGSSRSGEGHRMDLHLHRREPRRRFVMGMVSAVKLGISLLCSSLCGYPVPSINDMILVYGS